MVGAVFPKNTFFGNNPAALRSATVSIRGVFNERGANFRLGVFDIRDSGFENFLQYSIFGIRDSKIFSIFDIRDSGFENMF